MKYEIRRIGRYCWYDIERCVIAHRIEVTFCTCRLFTVLRQTKVSAVVTIIVVTISIIGGYRLTLVLKPVVLTAIFGCLGVWLTSPVNHTTRQLAPSGPLTLFVHPGTQNCLSPPYTHVLWNYRLSAISLDGGNS